MLGLWICLIILYVWQAFEVALDSKCTSALSIACFYMQTLCKALNMAQHNSIMPAYALMSINMSDPGWKLLNVPEYVWKCPNKLFWLCQGSQYITILYIWQCFKHASGIKYGRILNMLWHSYNNNIIIVTNAIISEFLCAWFVYPFYLFHFI